MIFLAVLGVLQALLLPGLVAVLWAGRRYSISWLDRLLFSTPLSLVFNYLAVVLLVWLDEYVQDTMWLLLAVELLLIVIFMLRMGASERIRIHLLSATNATLNPQGGLRVLTFIVLLVAFVLNLKNGGFVFYESDAVLSWNRWAQEWFHQQPGPSMGYPPALPILMSLSYVTMGVSDVQVVAKMMVSYFPFYGLLCLWRIRAWQPLHAWTTTVGGLMFVITLITAYGGRFLFSGFTDPVVAGLAAFVLYALAVLHAVRDRIQDRALPVALSVLFVSALVAASLVKQTGAVMAMVAVGFALLLLWRQCQWQFARLAGLVLLAALLVGHWYVYSLLRWHDYNGAELYAMTNPDLGLRFLDALHLTWRSCGPFVSVFFAIGLFCHGWTWRLPLLWVVPLWVFWALMASYDFRSASPLIPVVAMVAAAGLVRCGQWLSAARFSISQRSLSLGLVAVVLGVGLALSVQYPSSVILQQDHDLRIRSGDEGFNAHLARLLDSSPDSEKMLSCWQPPYNFPESRDKFVLLYPCDSLPQRWVDTPDLAYLLFAPAWDDPAQVAVQADAVRLIARSAHLAFTEQPLPGGFILFRKLAASE